MLAVQADVADPSHAARVVSTVTDHFGRLDVFVNNAAMYVAGELTDVGDDTWDALRRTNLDAFVHLARTALPELDFDAVLPTHGQPVLDNGKAALKKALEAKPWYHHG